MIEIALYEPEIPPNTGNVIRLCANTGARLHLIQPLGFRMDDASLRRAGLDYHEYARVEQHASLDALRATRPAARLLAFTTRGTQRFDQWAYQDGDLLLFGPESRGLPAQVLETIAPAQRLYLPMQPDNRSLNLSNAVAVAAFEAWRQQAYDGAAVPPTAVG